MNEPNIDWIAAEEGPRRGGLQLQLVQCRIDKLLLQPGHRIRMPDLANSGMRDHELGIIEPDTDRRGGIAMRV